MKNTLKKISAIAMAFTLLGTGSAISAKIAPSFSNNSITAHAANYTKNYEQYTDPGNTILARGWSNNSYKVKWVQAALNHYSAQAGWSIKLDVDGVYGKNTENAVKTFQGTVFSDSKDIDGKFGPKTCAKLKEKLKHTPNNNDPQKRCSICGRSCR